MSAIQDVHDALKRLDGLELTLELRRTAPDALTAFDVILARRGIRQMPVTQYVGNDGRLHDLPDAKHAPTPLAELGAPELPDVLKGRGPER